MGIIVAVAGHKGGDGKTTTAFNLAHTLADEGDNVLALDDDPQGNLTFAFLGTRELPTANIKDIYESKPVTPYVINKNLHFIGADKSLAGIQEKDFEVIFNLADGLKKLKKNYDYIIIDCLPSFGRLQTACLLAADYVLVPFAPDPFCAQGLADFFVSFEKIKHPRWNPNLKMLGILRNNVPSSKTNLSEEITADIKELYGEWLFESFINTSVVAKESPALQQSVIQYQQNHKLAKQYKQLAKEFRKRMEKC
jgi:chromosome partitioning protein